MRRTSSEKKGLVMSATTTPINRVDCIRSPCATLDGAKPSSATASWTRALSGALTKLVPLMTFGTDAGETCDVLDCRVRHGAPRCSEPEREPGRLVIERLSRRLFNEDQACGCAAAW